MTVRYSVLPDLTGSVHRSKSSRLFEVQHGLCYLCREQMTKHDPPTDEHVIPKSLGGGRLANILLAHERCNIAKANRPPRPCELIYLASVYLRLPGIDSGKGWRKRRRFVPLRARLAAPDAR